MAMMMMVRADIDVIILMVAEVVGWIRIGDTGGMRHATSYDLRIDAGRCRDYIT